MKAQITISQTQVLDMLRKSNPGLTNLRVVVTAGYEDRFDPRGGSPPSFKIEADVEVAVPVLDGGK